MDTDAYAYNYDPIGNRQSAKLNDDTTSYAANGLNQYTNITGGVVSAPTYDLDGNMTFLPSTSGGGAGGEGWHCQWDAENRLLTVSNLTTAVVASYTYDHQSRRIFKKVVNSSLITQQSSFTYDGWNMIHEQTSTNTSSFIPHTSSLYVWGLDLSGTLQGAGGVGGLLSQTKITASGASSYFPLADANGNAVTYLDNAGNVQAHYTYDAFGAAVFTDGDMGDYFRFRFSSTYLDDETGLYYYGFRYYAPVLGRWLSTDSIWERGGLLLYGFTRNSPVCGLCTQGTHGYIQDLMTPIKICYGKGGTDNVFQTVKHELQHAKDACPDNWPENCEEMVKFETRAYFCSGQCNDKKTCADAARRVKKLVRE